LFELSIRKEVLQFKTIALKNKKGKFDSFLLVIENITQSVRDKQVLREKLEEKDTVLTEIHHRIKNNLSVLESLFYLEESKAEKDEVRRILKDSQGRIKSISKIHELLYRNEGLYEISIEDYIDDILIYLDQNFNLARKEIKFIRDISPVKLDTKQAVPLALLLNEVIVNIYKHAFQGIDNGTISMHCESNEDMFRMSITDDGIGMENIPSIESKSTGIQLMEQFSKQLDATFNYLSEPDKGTTFSISFKLI
jgi:two-component sensor histidine kinase